MRNRNHRDLMLYTVFSSDGHLSYYKHTVSMHKVWQAGAKRPTAVRAHYLGQGDTKQPSQARWRDSTMLLNYTLSPLNINTETP